MITPMKFRPCFRVIAFGAALLLSASAQAALIVNSPMPITDVLWVNPIIVSDDSGGDTATFMGAAEAAIKGMVDTIWAQAGIDVQWLTAQTFKSTETLNGGITSGGPRPSTDLSTDPGGQDHETLGEAVRIAGAINMFFVNVAAGHFFYERNAIVSAGLAERPGDDISMFVGTGLFDIDSGDEIIAHVISHEIGHNLSLRHPEMTPPNNMSIPFNLMNADSNTNFGQQLNSAQIAAALASGRSRELLVAIPEANAIVFMASACSLACIAAWTRARRQPA
jgi:hypothetical protein